MEVAWFWKSLSLEIRSITALTQFTTFYCHCYQSLLLFLGRPHYSIISSQHTPLSNKDIMELTRIIANLLRALQLASATIVTGITGYFLYKSTADAWDLGRFIYTEVAASLSMFLAILFLFPFTDSYIQVPVDIIVSLLWWAAFGLLYSVS